MSKLPAEIGQLVHTRMPWYGLPREFYLSGDLYEHELEQIWRRHWIFSGHSCEAPRPGDFFTISIANDPLILIRGDDGQLKAFFNVCRHRGAILCSQSAGRVHRIICPYHQWTYLRDGRLASCRGMQTDVDTASLGLKQIACEEIAGLVFVSLSDNPVPIGPARQLIEPAAQPQGLLKAKVAKAIDYRIAANWKVVWENNRECYHCNVNHPEYIQANYDIYDDEQPNVRKLDELAQVSAQCEQAWSAHGLALTHNRSGLATFPNPSEGVWYSADRTPLAPGYVSESLDGAQVAKLMGSYTTTDVGTLRLRTVPNFWCHASCDHAVTTRLLPDGLGGTWARVAWLVHEDAVEGRDFELERLLPFWQLTSEQDWGLCEGVQRGLNSQGYEPGPLSKHKEGNLEKFLLWYLGSIAT